MTTSAGYVLPKNSLSILRGASKTLELTVTDSSGEAVDLTGSTLWFTVKGDIDDAAPVIQKCSSDVLQIEITHPRGGIARVYLLPSDTKTLDAKEYVFDMWVVLVSGQRYPIIKPSVFEVEAGVTVLS